MQLLTLVYKKETYSKIAGRIETVKEENTERLANDTKFFICAILHRIPVDSPLEIDCPLIHPPS